MRTRIGRSSLGALGMVLLAALVMTSPFPQASGPAVADSRSGASWTRLSDGRWLVLGGEEAHGPSRTAAVWTSSSGIATPLSSMLNVARAWHTATVLPDGTVLIFGGLSGDTLVDAAELFDPATEQFSILGTAATTGLAPRAFHTATLLTDGRVLVAGGVGDAREPLTTLALWDPTTATVESIAARFARLHVGAAAVLEPDGTVFFASSDEQGAGEVFDPSVGTVVPVTEPPTPASESGIAASVPQNGASIAAENSFRITLRSVNPIRPESATTDTVRLRGPDGVVDGRIVVAEAGMLVFFKPTRLLQAAARYRFTADGVWSDNGTRLPRVDIRFTTRGHAKDNVTPSSRPSPTSHPEQAEGPMARFWEPTQDWRTNATDSPWRMLPALRAAPGATAISGQVLRLDGEPLRNVTIQVGSRATQTDETGRFLLDDVPSGHVVVVIDGRTANRGRHTYGVFEYGMTVRAHDTNVWSFTSWMPLLDTVNAVEIPSPMTSDVVVTTPRIPGLELHLPAGSVIRDHDGEVATRVSITPIPVDRPPFPLPAHVEVPIYFTVQPGGGYVQGAWGSGAHLVYPNYTHQPPRNGFKFWHYDPDERGWYVYGVGRVTDNGRQVMPEPTTVLYEFTGAMINGSDIPPNTGPPPGDCSKAGDPCMLSTGLLVQEETDLVVPDVMPLELTRTYRQSDPYNRPFGTGTNHPYALYLWIGSSAYDTSNFVLPDGGRVFFVRTSPPGTFNDAVLEHRAPDASCPTCVATPTLFDGARMAWNGRGWDVTLKDGTVYVFGEQQPLQAIRDRYGNQITITRESGDQSGNIARVTSPNGRWIAFTYNTNNNITDARDNAGRTVHYTYDGAGNLISVRKPNPDGGSDLETTYTYDATSGGLKTIRSAQLNADCPAPCSGPPTLNVDYYTDGSVKKETLGDGFSTWQYTYMFGANGRSTQTDVTDPRGYIRRVLFNSDGYATSDTRALGQTEQQVRTYVRETGTNRILSEVDGLNHRTEYGYDARGNMTLIKRLAETIHPISTQLHYEANFNQLDTITDPLTHAIHIAYRTNGSLQTVTNALMHTWTFGANAAGQITSITDPLTHPPTQFGYTGGDLTSITDAYNNTTTRVVDPAGQLRKIVDPLGHATTYDYDNLGRLRKITDPLGRSTNFTYDRNANLMSIGDGLGHLRTYHYDAMDRVDARIDPLMRIETYVYDGLGNVLDFTDRKGQVVDSQYDGLNRPSYASFLRADGNLESVMVPTYDGRDRLRSITDVPEGVTSRDYDDRYDEVITETTPNGSISYTYDDADRRQTMTIAGSPNTVYSYSFDDADRLYQIAQDSNVVGLTYYDDNQRKTVTLANGAVVTYGYDNADRLISINGVKATNTLIDLTYGYDAASNRTSIGGASRVTGVPGTVGSTTYDAANELRVWGSTTVNYDLNGNVANETTGGVTTTYTWDIRNRLTGITKPGTSPASFVYDGLGRRTTRAVNGATTTFLYDGINRAKTATGGVASFMLDGLVIDQHFARMDGANVTSFLTDTLGSTHVLTDATATVTAKYAYEPYGKASELSGSASTDLQFTGREDDGTELAQYRARYYAPRWGRFISEDPLGFLGGNNLYAYAADNPMAFVDPLGLNYGTNDCEHYSKRCRQSGGDYYCKYAPAACNWFAKPPDPDPSDPSTGNPVKNWTRCARQCLQDCDHNTTCPLGAGSDSLPWNPGSPSTSCHVRCYTWCAVPHAPPPYH